MSLFVVNRYEDEEWKEDNKDSQNHLSDLLKRIAERKRERDAAANAKKTAAESKVEDAAEQQREKAIKTDIVEEQNDFKQIAEATEEVSKKKKNKRGKKRKSDISNEEVAQVENERNVENGVATEKDANQISQENFTILGSKKQFKTQVAKRVLPHWLTHPEIVHADLSNGPILDEVQDLDSKLVEKLKADGFNKLFPVQAKVLSWLIKCDQDYKMGKWVRDTCISVPTGSGKTLAYALPIIQLLQHNFVRLVRCLIVLPVQELATQAYIVISKYAAGTCLKTALISGAASFKEEQEKLIEKTEKGDYISKADIVIATPGRLIDHIKKTEGFSFSALRFLVIDEADRETEWLQYIPFPHAKPPSLTVANIRSSWNTPAQKVLLSATLSQDPEKLSRLGLFRPILFTSVILEDLQKTDKDINLDKVSNIPTRYGNPSELTERIVECSNQHKPLALYQLLTKTDVIEKTLVFTNSAESAHRLAILLQSLMKSENITIGVLSAQFGSKQREETLEKFIRGTLRVLVSSDALARGLDIPGIKLVVSYDLPKDVKGYIHRAGRTGRGGNPGTAVSLLLPNQIALFSRMLNKVGKSVPTPEKESLDEVAESVNYESHLENLQTTLANEQTQHVRRLKSHKRAIKA